MNYQFLCGDEENLDNKITILLESKQFYWSEIYIFSAFFDNDGVEKVKQILLHDSLTQNAKIVIFIGGKSFFNEIKNIKKLLAFIESEKSKQLKNKSVHFICPKNNFHIKAYCFLGQNRNNIKADIQIGVSIIGSSNLTNAGLKCQGELCISIVNFNLTKTLIARLSKIYIDSNEYDLWEEIINKYKNDQYNSWVKRIKEFEEKINNYNEESPENQNEDSQPLVKAEYKYVQDKPPITSTPQYGKFIELGVLADSVLLPKASSLANYSDNIDCFYSNQAIDEEKNDVPQNSLCILFSTENKIFRIVEIMSYCSYQETKGCFVTYRENLNYELSDDDIRETLKKKEKYKIISVPKDMEKLPCDTLKDFKKDVQEYRQMLSEMLKDPNYQKGLEQAKNKMQSEIDRLFESESDSITLTKEQLKKLIQSI